MIWVDEVLAASAEDGECQIVLKQNALYMDGDKIKSGAFIEWIAQAFAYTRSAHFLAVGDIFRSKIREGFLVGIRNAKILFEEDDSELMNAKSLYVFVDGFRTFGPIVSLNGEVRTESGRVLMSGSLRIYQQYSGG
jgi:predicted hotdog family 3-hydroxylacyl-ACP dehydratase